MVTAVQNLTQKKNNNNNSFERSKDQTISYYSYSKTWILNSMPKKGERDTISDILRGFLSFMFLILHIWPPQILKQVTLGKLF